MILVGDVSRSAARRLPTGARIRSETADGAARDSVASGDPMAGVDRLIGDLQTGKIRYAPEIAGKVRPHALTLGAFPCRKYILGPSHRRVNARRLATEIVPRGEDPRYKKSVTIDSKLTEKQNRKDLERRKESIRDQADELYRQRTESLMVLVEGDNADGKDGVLDHVFHLSPLTTTGSHAFKAARGQEKLHPPNWRIMQHLAGPGQIGFHNRTAYGDIVFAAATEAEKAQRAADIKEMEYGLTMGLPTTPEGHIALPDAQGHVEPTAIQRPPMRFIKVLLNVSKAEQAARLASRLTDESKLDKASPADVQAHDDHDSVQSAFATAMSATSTPWAPTYVIPNDNKPMGWRKIAQIADEILADMDPERPGGDLGPRERKAMAEPLLAEVKKARRHKA